MRAELDAVRRLGVHHVPEDAVPHLLTVLRVVRPSAGMPVAVDLARLLDDTIADWGEGEAAVAARCTFGLTARTRLMSGAVRRHAAAETLGISDDHFRKTRERELLGEVASGVVARCLRTRRGEPVVSEQRSTPGSGYVRVSTLDDESEFSLRALIDGARTVVVHGKNWVNLFNQQSGRLADVVRRGGSLRILLVPPDPTLGTGVYSASGEASGRVLVDNVRTALDRIADLRADVGDAPGHLELRFADLVPQYAFIGVGRDDGRLDRGLVQIAFGHTRRGSDRFVLCLPEGVELTGFLEEFEAAWSRADVEVGDV